MGVLRGASLVAQLLSLPDDQLTDRAYFFFAFEFCFRKRFDLHFKEV